METPSNRAELEQHIIDAAWKVNVSKPEGSWLDDEQFQDFLKAWSNLVDYYSSHADDSVIGVEVLREYVRYSRVLRNLLLYHDISETRRQQATEALESLERMLEEIIREVVTYLDFVERGLRGNQKTGE